MIPAGYSLKRSVSPPDYLKFGVSNISEVCSASNCVEPALVDPSNKWFHNGFDLANSPDLLWTLASEEDVDLFESKLFYHCAYEWEISSDGRTFDPLGWKPISRAPSSSVENDVVVPSDDAGLVVLGYDVVVFGDYIEHSPLSCQSIAMTLHVNTYCLFDSLGEAKSAIDTGKFIDCKEGIYKIFSVSLLKSPRPLMSASHPG